MNITNIDYYSGIEKRIAAMPRRLAHCRRHRTRSESLVSDCRMIFSRRCEDEEGYIDAYNLNADEGVSSPDAQPQIEK